MRVEFPINSNDENYNIVDFKEDGVLVFAPTEASRADDSELWTFTFLNKYLEKKWQKTSKLSKDLNFIKQVSKGNSKYLVFHNSKNKDLDVPSYIVKTEIDTAKLSFYSVNLPPKHIVSDFEVINNKSLIGVESRQQMPKLFIYDFKNNELKKIESYNEDNGYIEDVKIDNGNYIVITRREPSRDTNYIEYCQFDPDGVLMHSIKIDHPMEKLLFNNGQFLSVSPEQKLIIGTFYRSRQGKTQKSNELDVELSTGVYLAIIEGDKLSTLKYHSFSEFDNFYNYLNTSNIGILSKSIDQKKKMEKGFMAHFSLLLHDVIQTEDQLILAAETFYPEYRQERRVQYDYYGRMYPSYQSVFEGYRFNNALVAGFDLKGDLVWNNSMDMDEILSHDLYRRAHVAIDSNDVFVTYAHEGYLISKNIEGNKVSKYEDRISIQLDYATDILIEEGSILFRDWYEGFYLLYGYQIIRNNNIGTKNKRNVFFINKIALQ
ncbi:MAG: hypothetical protein JEZ03_05145 [Bacteroidales bacterium]|nr:hypothetical protein [Bacteroidales bacterium]